MLQWRKKSSPVNLPTLASTDIGARRQSATSSAAHSVGQRIIVNAPLEPAIGRIILIGPEAVNPAVLIIRSHALAIACSSRDLSRQSLRIWLDRTPLSSLRA